MSNPNALFLLADHIKLSLLERQRAKTLNLESDTQDGHISRSLEQFKDGLAALQTELNRLEEAGDAKAASISDTLPQLQKQYDDLTSQFHGFASTASTATLTHPNDPALAEDFAHATSTKPSTTSRKTSLPKTVRFSDSPLDLEAQADAPDASRSALFNSQPYRDDPSDGSAGFRDRAEALDNVQVHQYHQRIMEDQDAQLDVLGQSIGRQRELSMQIGDELDDHVAMLDETERVVDRHQSRLDRGRKQIGRIARAAGESKQMVAIVVLIVILILLIAVVK
ncbi:SNARE domain-containing protein [Coniochaeta ligniaria NRRL 30616]|uniref:SNARE domain-containing protein n=1 Tax=Coniochaeta ligniaria NRRL 30616 TaxID=1408157 RepID=A0A1J7IET3_9PEZI|nr:SNARE domain-containing protein [Coniochaeta ligniaria NRRL 30616]